MEKMIIKRVPLKLSEMGKLRDVLVNELFKNKDVQIFLEKKLFDELKYNYFDYDLEPADEEESRHYAPNMQHFYSILGKRGKVEGQVVFIENSKDFMQVSKFKDGNFEYIHYLCGMRKVVVISEKKEENGKDAKDGE